MSITAIAAIAWLCKRNRHSLRKTAAQINLVAEDALAWGLFDLRLCFKRWLCKLMSGECTFNPDTSRSSSRLGCKRNLVIKEPIQHPQRLHATPQLRSLETPQYSYRQSMRQMESRVSVQEASSNSVKGWLPARLSARSGRKNCFGVVWWVQVDVRCIWGLTIYKYTFICKISGLILDWVGFISWCSLDFGIFWMMSAVGFKT